MQSIQSCAQAKREAGEDEHANILDLLGRATSMRLVPKSINQPFAPLAQDFQAGRRSAIPDDFTVEELAFFEEILNDVNDPWVQARLADLLWLCRKPKNPDHARIAIAAYLQQPINADSWLRDVDDCWERAARLAMQIKDFDKLDEITNQLFAVFSIEHPGSPFMPLWLASLLDRLQADKAYGEDIAHRLLQLGNDLKNNGDFYAARSYFELSAKKYQQCSLEKDWLDSLISIAESFEQEADSRSSGSNMVANSFYENTIQAYRRIPTKHRATYDVENRIYAIRTKISDTGKASLDEMALIKTPGIDISDIVEASISHVAGKRSPEESLLYLAGIYSGPDLQALVAGARESMQESVISSLFGSSHMSSDGRVITKTPPANLGAGEDDPANKAVLNRQIQQHLVFEIQFVVEGQILPALRQILMERRITQDFLEALCHHSPIVQPARKKLLSFALWLGFEYEFGHAIHLLCPQFEHIVRVQLKEAGAHTTTINTDGIEHENGLSTLMELPEATEIFGEDLTFEIKSIFTEALGFNLRNETAHGLLDDSTSSSIQSVYAWWMILRMVIHSLANGSSFQKAPPSNDKKIG
jgi:tetratricopeptide (TPR) repeat protein|tara:strand:- start:15177 stop:16937 length:1761 start_codon:yes stop_codon:yes gene_type:complete